MDKTKATPKDFFLWAGAMVTLYWSVISFLQLFFDYINYAFPNPLAYYPADPYQSGISYEMASLIVLFPIFLLLMHVIRRDIRADASRGEVWVRRWALFLTLFVAGITMAGDLIWLLTAFLNGTDITTPFLLKAAIVFLVAAGGFMHFISDFWGYWEKNPSYVKTVGYVTGVLVLVVVCAGFLIVGTPQQARLARFDAQKVQDLQNIQSQVVNYWQQKQKLPTQLSDLADTLSYNTIPTDPQTKQAYAYKITGTLSFELCAAFNAPSQGATQNNYSQPAMPASVGVGGKVLSDNWQHSIGNVCFERTIDPQRYPPYTTKLKQ